MQSLKFENIRRNKDVAVFAMHLYIPMSCGNTKNSRLTCKHSANVLGCNHNCIAGRFLLVFCHSVVNEAGEGSIRRFTLYNSIISATSDLVYTVREIDEEGNIMWQFKRRFRLPHNIFSALQMQWIGTYSFVEFHGICTWGLLR
ncbi:unnamed protein product [Urochloa humidicola]